MKLPFLPRHDKEEAHSAGPTRRKMPWPLIGTAVLFGALAPIGLGASRPTEPPSTAVPDAAWQGLRPGMDARHAMELLSRRGYQLYPVIGSGAAFAEPAAGPCRAGWAADRTCERATLFLESDAEGVLRLRRIDAEAVLAEPLPVSSLLATAAERLGGQPNELSPGEIRHPRDAPLRRFGWTIATAGGPLAVELAVRRLEGEAIGRWRLVLEDAQATRLATLEE